jgi:hypothetical protein
MVPMCFSTALADSTSRWAMAVLELQTLKGQALRSWRFGLEDESGLGEEPVDEGRPVLDAAAPQAD